MLARVFATPLAAALAVTFGAASSCATAGTPLYHLTVLEVAGATDVTVQDINDAGQAVGTYFDEALSLHAVMWDAQGAHELELPPPTADDGLVDGIAYAINNNGEIVGTYDDFDPTEGTITTRGLLWTAATPDQSLVLGVGVRPNDINDDGVVVGGLGVPSRAFVWTAEDGVVDYGIQDPNVEDQQARWAGINASGTLIGYWNQHVSNIHATIGEVGTPAVLGMGGLSDEFPTNAVGLNDAGVVVGLGLSEAAAKLVPVIFDADGNYTEIAGATLDQDNGSAIAINSSGVIVGTAGIGTANGPVPGLKAWVYRDGTAYDLYEVVDDTAGFARFANAVAVNESGVIVGTGRLADDRIASFVLTPIQTDAVFANGFDP